MFKVHLRRTIELKAPFEVCVEINNDWTHFTYLHRKSIVRFQLIHKSGNREIFLCRGRHFFPLPIYNDYVLVREYKPSQYGYSNVYIDVGSGHVHYLDARAVPKKDATLLISDYLFSLPSCWRWFPKLFFWIFQKRMAPLMKEDNELIRERLGMEDLIHNDTCAPVVPSAYDIFDDLFKEDIFQTADARFEFSVSKTFGNKSEVRHDEEKILA